MALSPHAHKIMVYYTLPKYLKANKSKVKDAMMMIAVSVLTTVTAHAEYIKGGLHRVACTSRLGTNCC